MSENFQFSVQANLSVRECLSSKVTNVQSSKVKVHKY